MCKPIILEFFEDKILNMYEIGRDKDDINMVLHFIYILITASYAI